MTWENIAVNAWWSVAGTPTWYTVCPSLWVAMVIVVAVVAAVVVVVLVVVVVVVIVLLTMLVVQTAYFYYGVQGRAHPGEKMSTRKTGTYIVINLRGVFDKLQDMPHLSQVFLNSGDVSASNFNDNKIAIPFARFRKQTFELDMSKVGLSLTFWLSQARYYMLWGFICAGKACQFWTPLHGWSTTIPIWLSPDCCIPMTLLPQVPEDGPSVVKYDGGNERNNEQLSYHQLLDTPGDSPAVSESRHVPKHIPLHIYHILHHTVWSGETL